MKRLSLGIALLVSATLSTGCLFRTKPNETNIPVQDPEEVLEQIEALREAAGADSGIAGLEEVQIPLAEAWLEQPLNARYRALPANSAFRLVAQGQPMRFNFDEAGAPAVAWPPHARTIREHLDSIAAQADWSYALQNGVVQVHNLETKEFILHAQPGAVSSGINLRGLADAGGAETDNSMSLGMDPYAEEILTMVENVLGENGGQAALAPSANMLVVTARPNTMRKVEDLLARYNGSVSQIVRLELALIEVTFDDTEKRESLLTLIRRSNDLPLAFLIGKTGGSLGIGDNALTSPKGLDDLSRKPGQYRYDGSRAVFEWLDTFGDATINFDDTIEVLNNHVASVDVTETEQYVSRVSLRAVGEGNAVAVPQIEFAELRTGIVMHLQPTIVGDRITLRLGLSRSTPISRRNYQFSTISGTTFKTADFNRLLAVSLTDREPKLLASLSAADSRDRKTGVPILSSFGLGTSKQTEANRRETVMLITATIL